MKFLGGTLPPPQQSPCFFPTPRPGEDIEENNNGHREPRRERKGGGREDVGGATIPTEHQIENSRQWTQHHQTQNTNGVWSTKKQHAHAVRKNTVLFFSFGGQCVFLLWFFVVVFCCGGGWVALAHVFFFVLFSWCVFLSM